MALSRRQFFRRFWSSGNASPERLARYDALETYVRTQLLPYDFTLTEEQERELIAAVREVLEKTSNEELFSNIVRGRIGEIVEARIQPWRRQSDSGGRTERLREVRIAAPDYVSTFLNVQADTPIVEQLKQTYEIQDLGELEALLKRQIETWIADADDRLIQQYDVISVQDLVFAQLRSWC